MGIKFILYISVRKIVANSHKNCDDNYLLQLLLLVTRCIRQSKPLTHATFLKGHDITWSDVWFGTLEVVRGRIIANEFNTSCVGDINMWFCLERIVNACSVPISLQVANRPRLINDYSNITVQTCIDKTQLSNAAMVKICPSKSKVRH